MDRVIALIDMDAFYVQVEQRASPAWIGKPCAVVQYKGGGIIALNSEAKALGVKRYTMGQDARRICPSLHLFKVQERRGKADLTKYREAGAEVIRILVDSHVGCVERASVDEAFIDLTDEVVRRLSSFSASEHFQNTVVVGYDATESKSSVCNWLSHISDDSNGEYDGDRALAVGAAIVEELRAAIFEKAGFRCSAGVAHNKVLAKLSCGINKPNKQTVLPKSAIHHVFTKTPLGDVRGFGGKFGELVTEKLHVEFMADLCQFTELELQTKFGERGSWMYNVCRGVDHEPVVSRQIIQSIACSKNFLGRDKLATVEKVRYWLSEFAREACERLVNDKEKNNRIAKTMSVSVTYESFPVPQSATRSYPISRYDADKLAADAWTLIHQFNSAPAVQQAWSPPILHLGLSAGKFINLSSNEEGSIHKFFSTANRVPVASKSGSSDLDDDDTEPENVEFETSKYFRGTGEKTEKPERPIDDISTQPAAAAACTQIKPLHCGPSRSVQNLNLLSGKFVGKNKTMMRSYFTSAKTRTCEDERSDTNGDKLVMSEPTGQADDGKIKSMEEVDLHLKKTSTCEKITDNDDFMDISPPKRTICTAIDSYRDCSSSNQPDENSKALISARALDCSASESSFVIDVVQCEHCGIDVSPWELPEHLDWHVAVDLQKHEQTLSSTSRPNTKSSSTLSGGTIAKKRKTSDVKFMSDEKKSCTTSERVKKISTFFAPGAL